MDHWGAGPVHSLERGHARYVRNFGRVLNSVRKACHFLMCLSRWLCKLIVLSVFYIPLYFCFSFFKKISISLQWSKQTRKSARLLVTALFEKYLWNPEWLQMSQMVRLFLKAWNSDKGMYSILMQLWIEILVCLSW